MGGVVVCFGDGLVVDYVSGFVDVDLCDCIVCCVVGELEDVVVDVDICIVVDDCGLLFFGVIECG